MSLTQIQAYALTLLIEGAVAFLIAPRFGVPARRAALAAIIGSLISHPVFWPSAYALQPTLGAATIPLLEGLVVLFEMLVYRVLATKRWMLALALSAIANLASWAIGRLIFAVL